MKHVVSNEYGTKFDKHPEEGHKGKINQTKTAQQKTQNNMNNAKISEGEK